MGLKCRKKSLYKYRNMPSLWKDDAVYLEVPCAVAFPELDLEDVETADWGCETCETLFPTATYSH